MKKKSAENRRWINDHVNCLYYTGNNSLAKCITGLNTKFMFMHIVLHNITYYYHYNDSFVPVSSCQLPINLNWLFSQFYASVIFSIGNPSMDPSFFLFDFFFHFHFHKEYRRVLFQNFSFIWLNRRPNNRWTFIDKASNDNRTDSNEFMNNTNRQPFGPRQLLLKIWCLFRLYHTISWISVSHEENFMSIFSLSNVPSLTN